MKISLVTETKDEIIRKDITGSKIQILPDNCYVYQTVDKEKLINSVEKDCSECARTSCEYREKESELIEKSICNRIKHLEDSLMRSERIINSRGAKIKTLAVLNIVLLSAVIVGSTAMLWLWL